MSSINKKVKFGFAASLLLALTACSEEEIHSPSAKGIPQASDYHIGITVDSLNNVELNILDASGQIAKGVYPIWYVNESERPSTKPTYRDLITIAGEYPVEMKVGNANGVSDGTVTGTIIIDKTIFDFAPYITALTNGSSKDWGVDGTKDGNISCGPESDPTEWWKGGPGVKEAEGLYENILTFGKTEDEAGGSYIFNPGNAGTVYVNAGVNSLPGLTISNPGNGEDFRVAVSKQETTFALTPEGANLYLTLPPHTLFPYIPDTNGFENPKYRITHFSRNEITLAQDLGSISWQYIIAPKGELNVTSTGFKYDFEHNLWKDAVVSVAGTWFADGNWAELPDQPEVTVTPTNGITLHTPAGTGPDQWQGQVHVVTDIDVHAGVTYDFSCNIDVPSDGSVTVKVQKDGDDGTFFTEGLVEVTPGGTIAWFSDVEGFDGTLHITFDFGGYSDCDITVDNIVFKEHQYDDGTVIPAAAAAPSISDSDNLFQDFTIVKHSTWFADNDWSLLPDQPEITFDGNGYSFTAPAGVGSNQWQGQVHIWTDIATSADNKYDFILTIDSDKDIKQVTVKVVRGDSLGDDEDDDGVFIVADRINVEADSPCVYFFKGKKGIDAKNLQLAMDFGGIEEGTKVTVSDIKMAVAK